MYLTVRATLEATLFAVSGFTSFHLSEQSKHQDISVRATELKKLLIDTCG
jgi:hypothetical protein